jgi:hypothetical protein
VQRTGYWRRRAAREIMAVPVASNLGPDSPADGG